MSAELRALKEQLERLQDDFNKFKTDTERILTHLVKKVTSGQGNRTNEEDDETRVFQHAEQIKRRADHQKSIEEDEEDKLQARMRLAQEQLNRAGRAEAKKQ